LLLNQGVWDPDADATGFRLMFSGSSADVPTMLQKKQTTQLLKLLMPNLLTFCNYIVELTFHPKDGKRSIFERFRTHQPVVCEFFSRFVPCFLCRCAHEPSNFPPRSNATASCPSRGSPLGIQRLLNQDESGEILREITMNPGVLGEVNP